MSQRSFVNTFLHSLLGLWIRVRPLGQKDGLKIIILRLNLDYKKFGFGRNLFWIRNPGLLIAVMAGKTFSLGFNRKIMQDDIISQKIDTVCPGSSDPTLNIESNYFIQSSS